jgi:transposase
MIWLLACGTVTEQVAEVVGYSIGWIRTIARRYNAGGPEAIGDGRHQNPGGKPLLGDQEQAYLLQALSGSAPGGGKWNGPKVAQWMSEYLGRFISPQRGWNYLRAMEYRLKV